MLPAIVLFAAAYILMISFGRYRPYIALITGGLFVLTGMLPVNGILDALDFTRCISGHAPIMTREILYSYLK